MSSDEAIRRAVKDNGHEHANDRASRRLVELAPAEALALLGSVTFGRVVFTKHALPAIRPVNHLLDAGRIIIRTRLSAKISAAVDTPTVVAYEADQLDPDRRLGWSVVVTGYAQPVTKPSERHRLEAALTSWVDMAMDTVIAIEPEIVTGYRLAPAD